VLNWTTDVEENVSHFVIEKSLNGREFTEAGVLFTEGNSTLRREYGFKDDLKAITGGLVYYRLRIVDLDGKYDYSATRIIKMDAENAGAKSITVYPNPVVSELRITMAGTWQDKAVSIQLLNANGQSVKQISNTIAGQTATINVSDLAPGLYLVQVSDGREKAVQRFIKAK
jgi:type IX secretion system substrate protein